MNKLYTLPSCGICNMIKTKMNEKNIPFLEEDFSKIADVVKTDFAPVLVTGEGKTLLSPREMVLWINDWGK